jgi:glycosyltransferase involved in cell wall biosynthesis
MKNMKQLFILYGLIFSMLLIAEDKSFVIVAASYNNTQWYQKHLVSIFNQDYDNWRLIYIDDCSPDGTGYFVNNFIVQHNMQNKVTLHCNVERIGHLVNQYQAIHSCENNEIIVVLDGDDWFAHNGVLSYLNEVYQDDNVWLTYGSYERLIPGYPKCFCFAVPEEVVKNNTIRKHTWCLSHLRTFYAGLFKHIKKEDLMCEGAFFPMAVDLATMYPMFEMAGVHHKYIEDILMIYNNDNSLNLANINQAKRKKYVKIIKKMTPYQKLIKVPYLFESMGT